jgi:ABC-2 type transport system ATP-binding protein
MAADGAARARFRVLPGDFAVLLGPNGAGKSTLSPRHAAVRRAAGATIASSARRCAPSRARRWRGWRGVPAGERSTRTLGAGEPALPRRAARPCPACAGEARAERELGRIGLRANAAACRVRNCRAASGGGPRSPARCSPALPAAAGRADRSGLDAASRGFLLSHLRRLCREEGLSVLWATHLIDEVTEEARVLVLAPAACSPTAPCRSCSPAPAPRMSAGAFATLTDEPAP